MSKLQLIIIVFFAAYGIYTFVMQLVTYIWDRYTIYQHKLKTKEYLDFIKLKNIKDNYNSVILFTESPYKNILISCPWALLHDNKLKEKIKKKIPNKRKDMRFINE